MRVVEMTNETRNVFISHIHEDDSKLKNLKTLLQKHGMDVRDYSINSDKPNRAKDEQYIKREILAPQIKQCSVLVVYISEKTKDSHYVNWEIQYAHSLGKRIVGVWEEGKKECEIPPALDDYEDALSGWHGNNIINAINDDDSIQEFPDGRPRPSRSIKRHPC